MLGGGGSTSQTTRSTSDEDIRTLGAWATAQLAPRRRCSSTSRRSLAIPVIALTALAMKGDAERIRAAGCDGYIAKPVRYQELLAAVAVHLARS